MFVLFEEAGKYLGGRLMSEAESSAQVELDTGKRVKVKGANVVLRFEKPAPPELIAEAKALVATMDLDLAWEFAPEGEFSFTDLASDYFQSNPTLQQQAASLFALFEAPHYFRRAGKGRFKKAPAEIVQQALAAIEKKKAVQAQITEWAAQLADGVCPAPVREQLYKILFKPDKNAPEYKAVVDAARATQRAPLDLLERAGAIDSPYQFHWRRFLFENFPKGTGFPALAAPAIADELPRADGVEAFSIDDSQTTEIDDALSVQGLGSGTSRGRHPHRRARPGAGTRRPDRPGGARPHVHGLHARLQDHHAAGRRGRHLHAAGRARLPGRFAVRDLRRSHPRADRDRDEDRARADRRQPAARPARHRRHAAVAGRRCSAERRHARDRCPSAGAAVLPFPAREAAQGATRSGARQAGELHPARLQLPARRQRRRTGRQRAGADQHTPARRTARPDRLRSDDPGQQQLGRLARRTGRARPLPQPGQHGARVKVRMGTRALPHAGLGVKSYAWSTSPLRRYTDLVNQWQIIAAVRHGRTAALAAPFKPKDADLFSILSGFDAAYSTYNAYQGGMERFWTLKYLQQQGITELEATVVKDVPNGALVRADALPLVFPVAGQQPRGARLRVKLGEIDEIALDVHGTVLERLDLVAEAAMEEDDGGEEEEVAGPIAIAVDMTDSDSPAPADSTPALTAASRIPD